MLIQVKKDEKEGYYEHDRLNTWRRKVIWNPNTDIFDLQTDIFQLRVYAEGERSLSSATLRDMKDNVLCERNGGGHIWDQHSISAEIRLGKHVFVFACRNRDWNEISDGRLDSPCPIRPLLLHPYRDRIEQCWSVWYRTKIHNYQFLFPQELRFTATVEIK